MYVRRALHAWRPDLWTADGYRLYFSGYLTARELAEQLGVDKRILIRQAKKGRLRYRMGKAMSGPRMYPAMFVHVQEAVWYNAKTFAGKIQFKKAQDRGEASPGYLSTTKLAKQLGVNAEKLGAQARRGCYPSEIGREYDEEHGQYRKTMFVDMEEAIAYNKLTQKEKRAPA